MIFLSELDKPFDERSAYINKLLTKRQRPRPQLRQRPQRGGGRGGGRAAAAAAGAPRCATPSKLARVPHFKKIELFPRLWTFQLFRAFSGVFGNDTPRRALASPPSLARASDVSNSSSRSRSARARRSRRAARAKTPSIISRSTRSNEMTRALLGGADCARAGVAVSLAPTRLATIARVIPSLKRVRHASSIDGV